MSGYFIAAAAVMAFGTVVSAATQKDATVRIFALILNLATTGLLIYASTHL
jgi:ABC-type transport system involved in cytochrome bd biosynthesis fused ATPase/permease subunit